MNIYLCGRRWRLAIVPRLIADGECDEPNAPRKTIRIAARTKGRRRLEVLLHEMLHACAWHLDESIVATAAEDIARSLWRIGYREQNETEADTSA